MAEVTFADLQNAILRSPVHRVEPVAPLSPEVRPKPFRVQVLLPDGSARLLPVESFGYGEQGMVLNVTLPPLSSVSAAPTGFADGDLISSMVSGVLKEPDWHVGAEREVEGFDGGTPVRMEAFRGSKESNPGVNNQ